MSFKCLKIFFWSLHSKKSTNHTLSTLSKTLCHKLWLSHKFVIANHIIWQGIKHLRNSHMFWGILYFLTKLKFYFRKSQPALVMKDYPFCNLHKILKCFHFVEIASPQKLSWSYISSSHIMGISSHSFWHTDRRRWNGRLSKCSSFCWQDLRNSMIFMVFA